jgi:hypothetical protein
MVRGVAVQLTMALAAAAAGLGTGTAAHHIDLLGVVEGVTGAGRHLLAIAPTRIIAATPSELCRRLQQQEFVARESSKVPRHVQWSLL